MKEGSMKKRMTIRPLFERFFQKCIRVLTARVYFGRHLEALPNRSIVFFPCRAATFCCGLAGLVAIKKRAPRSEKADIQWLDLQLNTMECRGIGFCTENRVDLQSDYLSGGDRVRSLLRLVRAFKCDELFIEIYRSPKIQSELARFSERVKALVASEERCLKDRMGHLPKSDTEVISSRIEDLKDIYWCLTSEIAGNIEKITALAGDGEPLSPSEIRLYKEINTALNSLDRLEVRGRDSAGISLLFLFSAAEYDTFQNTLEKADLLQQFAGRTGFDVLLNRGIHVRKTGAGGVSVTFTYKIAAEIGKLGDNVRFIRDQIRNDALLRILATFPPVRHTVLSHTRWASVGAITEANCHPIDNRVNREQEENGCIHVCLNGDIDNYQELKEALESTRGPIPGDITTDTKIIPLQIEKYLMDGFDITEAFRLALNDFKGSHAIAMHTDLAPGKLFLAQRGSGQAIFVGIGEDHYMPTSEAYGFVEETSSFIKVEGDRSTHGKNGRKPGQILILDQESGGGLEGIRAMGYDGTPVRLQEENIKKTEITSRDIDRQGYSHYFLKEISEAPLSIEKTLQNRWKIGDDGRYIVSVDGGVFPQRLQAALASGLIRRFYFIGQGTAGVAGLACANILQYYLNDPSYHSAAVKASEFSGFNLNELDGAESLADTLVIAISQSGTTTDTNRAVEMVRERGGKTIGIVNRRDSDLTFKVDGVMYTSSGRDIEMSVASTKAFYSQIVAGALLGLDIAHLTGRRDAQFISDEIKQLLKLPSHMRQIFEKRREIQASAERLATKKTYWAAVGSGPNKASADEIRIKLSELCYKTISSDYVEDKKHIDLSSEPLIIVCAAGARDSVIGDIIKDTAIFKAHKADPIVIANEGEHRFEPYAADVIHVPIMDEHLAPIINTLAGHIWGYYAALAMNEGSRLLYEFRQEIQGTLEDFSRKGMDVYEVVLENTFREKIAEFYQTLRAKKLSSLLPIGSSLSSDLILLLKYLSGRLPVSDFELDFGKKGTALNMLNSLFECLGESINRMARPIDAIKHQAKTVTVGTSRISDKVEGILYDALSEYGFSVSQLTPSNVIVLRNLQGIILRINGSILYRIDNLSLLGDVTGDTTIRIVEKRGMLVSIPSRVESDKGLKGTKRIIVQEGNVYIGMGRRDERSILIVPIISNIAEKAGIIESLLLLNISFKENVPLDGRKKALGGKYERIKNIVQENSLVWHDRYLEMIEMKELFGRSAEKIAEFIVSKAK